MRRALARSGGARFLAMLLLAGCGADWQEAASTAGRFKVAFPGPTEAHSFKIDSSSGEVEFHGISFEPKARREFPLLSRPYPPAMVVSSAEIGTRDAPGLQERVEAVMSRYVEEMTQEKGVVFRSRTAFAVPGCTGLRIELEFKGARQVAYFCTISTRLYLIQMIGGEDQVTGPAAKRFLASFRATQ